MPTRQPNTLNHIRDAFTQEILGLAGIVQDIFEHGGCLMMRSILPLESEVQPRDLLRGGIALKSSAGQTEIYPYIFRRICTNGAIMTKALPCKQIINNDYISREQLSYEISQSVRMCGAPEMFTYNLAQIGRTLRQEPDPILSLLPMLSKLASNQAGRFLAVIQHRFLTEEDRSQFGLMNAITSVARDTANAEWRWKLEVLGGSVPFTLPNGLDLESVQEQETPIAGGIRQWRPCRESNPLSDIHIHS